jgi:TonB family protein
MWPVWLCLSAITLGVVGPAADSPSATPQTSRSARIRTNDKQLREWAIASPRPSYPPRSLAKKVVGVVVVALRTDYTGATEAVEILQSPDADTGAAVRDAVKQWTFKPMTLGGEGMLVFYFHIQGSRGVVLSPTEMRDVINPGVKNVERSEEPPVKSLTEAEFRALSERARVVLDFRDRETFKEGHVTGAVNMPLGEILARAQAELRASDHIVIDCRDPPSLCAMVAHQVASSGVRQISILRR